MPIADAARKIRHVFLRDLELEVRVGVYRRERMAPQRLRFNVDLGVAEGDAPPEDAIDAVVSYETILERVRAAVLGAEPAHLLETLAERAAAACLEDPRVLLVRLRVEKPDVFPEAASAGVEIERRRSPA